MKSRKFVSLVSASIAVVVAATSTLAVAPTVASESAGGHFGSDGRSIAGDFWDPAAASQQPMSRALSTRGWPDAATVVARLRARGVSPILVDGYNSPVWEQNAFLDGLGSSVNAVMMHDTGTSVPASRLNNTHSLNWIVSGVKNSRGQTVRACHLYVARNGDVYVVYARRTWHAGAGDSMFGVPANKMNGYSYGIEIESQGGGIRDLTAAQIDRASRVAAALLDASGLPVERVINHKDYAGRVQGKVDTAYPATFWRNKIDAIRGGPAPAPAPAPTPAPAPPAASAPPVLAGVAQELRANPRAISLSLTQYGSQNVSVLRYQRALRAFGVRLKLPLKRVNPSGATGYFGAETRWLTMLTYLVLRSRSTIWRNAIPAPLPYAIPRLIGQIGRTPIS